ncbi:MAG: exonuclease domain-containing protein [Pseudomonadota bacterium]
MLTNLSLRLRVFLFFCLLACGSLGLIVGGLFLGMSRLDPNEPMSAFVMAGLVAGFGTLGLVVFVWRLFDENVARAIEGVASAMRARAHGEVTQQLDTDIGRYLGDLAPAASAVTTTLHESKTSVAEVVSTQTKEMAEQMEKLTALVSDVPVGLILCNGNHQVVFYNAPSVELLKDTGYPRLGRSIFDLIREGPVRKTYGRLLAKDKDDQDTELMLATRGCGKVLFSHMRLVQGEMGMSKDAPGYVLTLRDVTADLTLHREREHLLSEMAERFLPVAQELRSDIEADAPLEDIAAKATALADAVSDVAKSYQDSRGTWWPMQQVRASELIDGLRAHLSGNGPALEALPRALILECDGNAIIDLLAALARAIHGAGLTDTISLHIETTSDRTELRLAWQGNAIPLPELEAVLSDPLDPDDPQSLSGGEVLDLHGSAVWPEWDDQGGAWLTLPLAEGKVVETSASPVHFVPERSAVFDFELLASTDHAAIDDAPLSKLTYVVFDTETTGLEPQRGDEIVQIAAVRVLNGRMVPGEVIDQLVDPERSIPAGATAVHGISESMVQGAPTIRVAGAKFHRFCENAVLVAHNAPFDMAFFHRHGPTFGAKFDNPVLDTVLLSAVLFGQQEEHTLDALAARFGVVIPDEARHTAYGDTLATAQVFLRMIPMLEAKGLHTFGAVLNAMEQNSRLMKEMRSRVEA